MKILYAYNMKEADFIPLAIAKYNKLAKTDVGKFSYDKNTRLPLLEDAYISISKVKDIIVAAISFEQVGVDVEPKDKVPPKKFKKTIQEYADTSAYMRWTGRGIIISILYDSFPEDKLKRFKIGDYIGSVYSIDGAISLIEIK